MTDENAKQTAYIALAVAVVALLISISAYMRTSTLDERIDFEVERLQQDISEGVAEAGDVDVDTPAIDLETAETVNELRQELARLEQSSTQAVTAARREARQDLAYTEARIRLLALQTELEAESDYRMAAQEVAEIRAMLARGYENAEGDAQTQYREADAALERLETDLQAGTADSLQSLEEAISVFEQDIESAQKDVAPADEPVRCANAGGTWRQFPNACTDSCASQEDGTVVCAQVLTYGCDCGPGQCWNGAACEPL